MSASSDYFLEKAGQCRRLAASITDEKAIEALQKLAEEFEAKAAAELTRERAEEAIDAAEDAAAESAGDNVVPLKPRSDE
jgi:hypothetical protein